jgi:hypothetical protein
MSLEVEGRVDLVVSRLLSSKVWIENGLLTDSNGHARVHRHNINAVGTLLHLGELVVGLHLRCGCYANVDWHESTSWRLLRYPLTLELCSSGWWGFFLPVLPLSLASDIMSLVLSI